MFEMKTLEKQTLDLRRENAKLRTALDKANSDVEYVAMMAGIELETDEETEDTDNEDKV